MNTIYGRNPVVEALQSGQTIEKIYIQRGIGGGTIQHIFKLARQKRVPVVQASHQKLTQMIGGSKHQGVIALISPVTYLELPELLHRINQQGEPARLLILDRIQDPQNLGAIIRSAEILGMHGVLLSSRDSAPLSETAIKASAGAVFHIPICKTSNLTEAVRYLKENNIWVYAASSHASRSLWELDFNRPAAIITGSEGRGVRSLLLKESDETFRIPQTGKTESLNASVATGIILAEWLRQRENQN